MERAADRDQDIERLEVVSGPSAAAFGANAFLGVVNIITRDPATESRFEAISNVGMTGIRDGVLRIAGNDGDLRYRLTVGQRADRGLESYPDDRRGTFVNLRNPLPSGRAGRAAPANRLHRRHDQNGAYSDEPNPVNGPRDGNYDQGHGAVAMDPCAGRGRRILGAAFPFRTQPPGSSAVFADPASAVRYVALSLSFDYSYRRDDLEMQRTLVSARPCVAFGACRGREDSTQSRVCISRRVPP